MTSVYEEKIYPPIYPATAPPDDDEGQAYRLQKISETEKFLRGEIDKRDSLTKRFKCRATAATFSDTSVLVAITALETASIATLITGIGIPVSVVLASTGLFLGIGSAVIRKTQRIFDPKVKKHAKIKTLAESKLDSISGLVSKSIENSHISHQEYQLILKEVEHYRTMKEEVRTKTKKTTDAITAEQREVILSQGREEGQQAFLAKIAATSGIQPANVMYATSLHPPMNIYEELIFKNISNVLVNRVTPSIVAIVVATELTLEVGISFSIFAFLQKDL